MPCLSNSYLHQMEKGAFISPGIRNLWNKELEGVY